MSFSYTIDKERRLVISTASDRVTFEQGKAHQDRLLNDPDFDPEFYQLLDATRVTVLDISIEQAKTLARRRVFSPNSRRAWVSPDPAIFGMGRLIAAYNEMSSGASQIHVFSDLRMALKWLGVEGLPELASAG
jgi:hypothetical protein